LGASISKLMPEHYGAKHDEYVQQFQFTSLRELVGTERELLGLRRNGKEFPIEVAVSEVRDGEVSYIGVIRDISERKHTEKLKNEFIATVSHELRTPLTSIAASLAIIESGSVGQLPDKANSLIQIAKQNSLRLQSLISDLLDMDKLLTNQMEFNLDNYDALATMQRAIDANKYYAEKYQISFRITHVEEHTLFHADIARTLQVLGHLLSNAAKFSPPHTSVDIAITRKTRWVRFSVTDHGAGIPNEFKAKIFTSFAQADSGSARARDGSGLGLTISRELVEKMGGNIGFTSSPGQGSCFYVELPLAKINSTTP
jgi:signal transduction histidine kinase